jgi:hypothetical protein
MSNSTTLLDTISSTQSAKETTANELFDAHSPASLFGRRASTSSGLTWGYFGGRMLVDGVLTAIANGTLALTASATNYVEATRAGVVSKNTTAFTAGSIPLYTIVTGTSSVTSYTDERVWVNPRHVTQQASVSITTADVTLSAAQAACGIIVLSGTLTGNRNLIVPNNWQGTVINNTSGSYTVTVKTSAGTGVTVTQSSAAVVTADGTNVVKVAEPAGTASIPDVTVNAQTGTTYTYLSTDKGKLVTHSNGSAIAGTLPQATGSFGSGWWMDVQNRGAGTLTITPTTSTIDGAASLALTTGQGVRIASDGTNYYTMRGADTASSAPTQCIPIACSDETTALTAGTGKVTFRMPYAFTLTGVRASLTTAQTSGSTFTVDINESGTSVLSTKLTIDNTEKTSTTAATAAVISDSALADDAEITIDIDTVGDGTAKGLKVYLIGTKA